MDIILVLLIIGLPLLAQIFIKISYENNSKIKNCQQIWKIIHICIDKCKNNNYNDI